MHFTLTQVFLLGSSYLLLLFACAWLAERNILPKRWARHPLVQLLVLGMYASAWAFYGSFGMMDRYGYGFLTYYFGISATFILVPVLLLPVLRLMRSYQLSSLADLLAFRYRSRWVGLLVTLGLLLTAMPLLALQIHAIGDVIYLMTNRSSPYQLALAFCVVIILFAILFGARHTSLREKHEGLILVLALDSLVKLVSFLVLGVAALWLVFGDLAGLNSWLAQTAADASLQQKSLNQLQWSGLLLTFFATALTMPHLFHVIFVENLSEKSLLQARWALPVFLLLLALPVPVIHFAAQALHSQLPAEYATLALGGYWNLLSFFAGLAAASGTLLVLTLALAPMLLNHVLLAAYQPPAHFDLYYWLLWMRRLLIAVLILLGYLLYLALDRQQDILAIGMASFIGSLQFLPGILALLFWKRSNRKGFLAGLCTGLLIWFMDMGLPLLLGITHLQLGTWILPLTGLDNWVATALLATLTNLVLLVSVSLLTRAHPAEIAGAHACSQTALLRLGRTQLQAHSVAEVIQRLSIPLGYATASREVNQALNDLQLSAEDTRPYALRRLRDQLQNNLSALMGAAVAQNLMDRYLPWQAGQYTAERDIHYVERRLENYRSRLTGMAAELDKLRRHHRQTLMHLPLGICTLGRDQELLLWNQAMEQLTGLAADRVIGSRIQYLPEPWKSLFIEFLAQESKESLRQPVFFNNKQHWISLHKARLEDPDALLGGKVLLVEDQTELKQLENELQHNERLASIGRLAAGVAHEIGNPVTGISSLAQNLAFDAEDPQAVRETSQQLLGLTQRITRIVQSLVSFSHAGRSSDHSQQFEPVNLRAVLEEAIQLIRLSNRHKPVVLDNQLADNLWVLGDAQRLVQVFVNLLANARDAVDEGGRILGTAQLNEDELLVAIHDEGHGIHPDQLPHLFEPFYTTKQAGRGTGLGLALVYSIVEEHRGQIEALSPSPLLGTGSCFICHFPALKPTGTTSEDHEPSADR